MTHHSTSEIVGLVAAPTLTNLKVLTGASAIISAAHRSREGQMHGHTWEVRAWWTGKPDAMQKQAELRSYLSIFDHTVLGDETAWAETLATSICLGMGCVKVEINRPLEGLFAVAELGEPS